MLPFADRSSAGRALADRLTKYRNEPDTLVLALPRGGVPVAFEVARELHAPLDVYVVRKLGVPGQEELAFGALASGGIRVLNDDVVESLGLPAKTIDDVTAREAKELERRERMFREDRPPYEVHRRTAILVDDGLATGATMRAAIRALRVQQPKSIVVAVPVAPLETCAALQNEADRVICAESPEPFGAVGVWYRDFTQTTDTEVQELLQRAASKFVH